MSDRVNSGKEHSSGERVKSQDALVKGLERIVGAAIRQDGVVHAGLNHATIINDIYELTGKPVWGRQGFVTERGRFVDRKEGLQIARAANQIKHKHPNAVTLYSEDLNCEHVECPYYSTQAASEQKE